MKLSFLINNRQLGAVIACLRTVDGYVSVDKFQKMRLNILFNLQEKFVKKYISKRSINPAKEYRITVQYYEAYSLLEALSVAHKFYQKESYEYNAFTNIINKLDQLTAI